jgi:hypothetical protein
MEELYIKKFWVEEEILFYDHFRDGYAERQIEVSSIGAKYYSWEDWPRDRDFLCDGKLENAKFDEEDFITAEEFEAAWDKRKANDEKA